MKAPDPQEVRKILDDLNGGPGNNDPWDFADKLASLPTTNIDQEGKSTTDFSNVYTLALFVNKLTGETKTYLVKIITGEM